MDQYIAHMTPKQMWTLKFLVLAITITAAFTDECSIFTEKEKTNMHAELYQITVEVAQKCLP